MIVLRIGFLLLLGGCSLGLSEAFPEPHSIKSIALVDANQSGSVLDYRWQPDVLPTLQRRSNVANSSYSVEGQTYKVWEPLDSYSVTGLASWRNYLFDEHKTVTGETFENDGLQAAHKYLTIPCWVEVTNLLTQKKALLRVNDRGPFHGDLEIDISRGAAEKLGFGDRLTVPVKVELVQPGRIFYVETDMVYGIEAAEELLTKVSQLDTVESRIMPHQYVNRYRVELGPFASVDDSRWVQRWLLINVGTKSTLLQGR